MSLWTPGGEHEVPRDKPAATPPPAAAEPSDAGAPPSFEDMPEFAELSPEEQERARAMAAEMAEAQQRVLETPAEVIVSNHAMGLFELAALHLNAPEPDLASARLAVDALGAIMNTVGPQLGEASETLNQALSQAQMAIVQLTQASAAPPEA